MNRTEAARDAAIIAGRHLLHLRQTPSLLALTIAQPALFVVLFNYGFGGAIRAPGVTRYIDYLLPGIVVLAIAFGSSQTGLALAEDNVNGITDRLRTLPIATLSIFVGRSVADTVRNFFVVVFMTGLGSALGFRFHRSLVDALGAIALVLALGLALSWLSSLIGLSVGTPETAQVARCCSSSRSRSPARCSSPSLRCPAGFKCWRGSTPLPGPLMRYARSRSPAPTPRSGRRLRGSPQSRP